jgi:RNA polymerase sigma-70 factor (ECF subfamily)
MADELGPDVVERLLRRKAQLLRFLARRVGSRADAEDVLQTALLRLVAKQRTLRRTDRVVPWFYRILENLVVDWHRRQAAAGEARGRIAADAAARGAWMDAELFREVCGCVWDVLAALRPEYAEIVRRVELDEQPLRQAARELGLTPNNASVRLHRARRALLEGLRLTCGACFEHGCLECFCKRRSATARTR